MLSNLSIVSSLLPGGDYQSRLKDLHVLDLRSIGQRLPLVVSPNWFGGDQRNLTPAQRAQWRDFLFERLGCVAMQDENRHRQWVLDLARTEFPQWSGTAGFDEELALEYLWLAEMVLADGAAEKDIVELASRVAADVRAYFVKHEFTEDDIRHRLRTVTGR